jgi:ABC-2 type transport system ATP-binding protein
MLMKAALLSSLAYRPKLLVLDEPFSGLDPLVREEFVRGVLEVSALGEWTVLVSSHDIDEVERLADRVALLDGGKLRVNESTDELLARYRRVEVTLGDAGAKLDATPATWLEVERAGNLVRFVENRYDATATERACRERFADATVSARAMSLREIFLVLAREGRGGVAQKGAAA